MWRSDSQRQEQEDWSMAVHVGVLGSSSDSALGLLRLYCYNNGSRGDQPIEYFTKRIKVGGKMVRLTFWQLTEAFEVEPEYVIDILKLNSLALFLEEESNLPHFLSVKKVLDYELRGLFSLFVSDVRNDQAEEVIDRREFGDKFLVSKYFTKALKVERFDEDSSSKIDQELAALIESHGIAEVSVNARAFDNLMGDGQKGQNLFKEEEEGCVLI